MFQWACCIYNHMSRRCLMSIPRCVTDADLFVRTVTQLEMRRMRNSEVNWTEMIIWRWLLVECVSTSGSRIVSDCKGVSGFPSSCFIFLVVSLLTAKSCLWKKWRDDADSEKRKRMRSSCVSFLCCSSYPEFLMIWSDDDDTQKRMRQ